jgi:hypothetical protein
MSNEALFQSTWFLDYVAGDNNNPGTALLPVKTASEIKRRWQGGVAGSRPVIPVSQTINLVSPAPDFTDPLLVLADVDLMAGARILVQPAAPTVKRAGTVTAITNAFARTPTGRLQITDVGVADWSSDRDMLFVDTTRPGVSWVTGGVTPAFLSSVRPPVNPAAPPFNGLGGTVTLIPGDTYNIVTPLSVYFGTGSQTRWGPNGGASASAEATITFSRLRGLSQGANDGLRPGSDGQNFSGATVLFEECRIDQPLIGFLPAGIIFANCAFQTTIIGQGFASDLGFGGIYFLAGYTRAAFIAVFGGVIFDQDFSSLAAAIQVQAGLTTRIGTASVYIGTTPLVVSGNATLIQQAVFDAASVFYGTTGGAAPVFNLARNSTLLYSLATAVATYVFDSASFNLDGQASAWGFDRAAGVFVGPTTCTFAHQDAALGAGTGFASSSQDPDSGARFLNA